MENQNTERLSSPQRFALQYSLGSFEGFNFRDCCAIERTLSGGDVVNWDHDRGGEAEFWPSGDHAGVALVFSGRDAVSGGELLALDRLLHALGGDSTANFLRIHYAVNCAGCDLAELTPAQVDDQPLHIFEGSSFLDLRREAALELFAMYYPEEFASWEDTHCDGLIFDQDRFLDSPSLHVEEVELGDRKALIVACQ